MNYRESETPAFSPCPATHPRISRAAALLCLFAAALPAQTNLVTNGGFEAPVISTSFAQVSVPNWTGTVVGTGTSINPEIIRNIAGAWPGVTGFGGDQWIELDVLGNAAISQDIPTTAGQAYRITFKYANRPGVSTSSIVARWNNLQVGSTFTTTSTTFQTATIGNLIATGPTSRITLEAAGPVDAQGDWIDDVAVIAEAAVVTPTLSTITTTPTAVLAGQPFIFNLGGSNFDPNVVQVLFTGPGCTPCTVTNAQLVTKSANAIQASTSITTAGNFTVTVQNGASGTQSSGLALIVSTPGPVVPSSLAFNYAGGANPTPQILSLQSPGGTGAQTSYSIDFPTVNWLSVSPTGGLTPANVTVTATPASLTPGTYNTQLTIRFAGGTNVNVPVTLTIPVGGGGGGTTNTNQVLSHVADSAGWQTTIILVNHDAEPAPYSLNFYRTQDSNLQAARMDLAFAGLAGRTSLVEGIIPANGSRTITTAGLDAALNVGWVELITTRNIQGSSIFRDTNGRQEAAVALTSGVRAFLLPVDNTVGRVTSFALVNTNSGQPATVNVTARDENGIVLGASVIPLGLRGHRATESTVLFPVLNGQRGSIEFSTVNADITGLGLRFDAPPTTAGAPRPFTSIPVQPRR